MKRIVTLIGLLLIIVILGASQWYAIRPSIVKPDKIEILLQKAQIKLHLREKMLVKIRKYIESQRFHSETERIDFIRDWVYRNSIHKIDAEHDRYARDTPRILFMLWRSYQTSKDFPHLSCVNRIVNRIVLTFPN